MICGKCGSEAKIIDIGSASGRKTYRCSSCKVQWREKNPAAVALGSLGGIARAKALSPEERSEQATNAITARWNNEKLRNNPIVNGARGILSGKKF